jgi:hypothetical protein
VELIVTLPEETLDELREAARRACSPRQFAIESLECVLASRRLPKVPPAAYGAQMCGTFVVGHEDETEMVLPEHRILL